MLAQDLPQPLPADPHHPVQAAARKPASLRRLHRVNGRPSLRRRAAAVARMNSSSSVLIRRGQPPHRGSRAARPISLNRWITSRTVSSPAATSRAIADTVVPLADAMMIVARRTRTDLFVDTAPDAWSEPHPAGRVNDRAGDPAAVVGGEEGDDGGDVVLFAEPTQRRHALGGPRTPARRISSATRSVPVMPGVTVLTVMPRGPRMLAIVRPSTSIAPLVTEYATR